MRELVSAIVATPFLTWFSPDSLAGIAVRSRPQWCSVPELANDNVGQRRHDDVTVVGGEILGTKSSGRNSQASGPDCVGTLDVAWGVANDHNPVRIEFGIEVAPSLGEGVLAEVVAILREVPESGDEGALSRERIPEIGTFQLELGDRGKVSGHQAEGDCRSLARSHEVAGAVEDPPRVPGAQAVAGELDGARRDQRERVCNLGFGHVAEAQQFADDVAICTPAGVDLPEMLGDVVARDFGAGPHNRATVNAISGTKECAIDIKKDKSGSHSQ